MIMRVLKPRKTQERTVVTRDLLLHAAERVFARVGYEKAQVGEIAEVAGFSKGALYAHFKSKEELFLALAMVKSAGYLAKLRRALDSAPTREGKIAAFRSFYFDLSKEREWALIILEVKLFVTRYPEAKERLRRAEEQVGESVDSAFTELFGRPARAAGEALGGIYSALVLEANLKSEVFPEKKMRAMLGTIFDALVGISDQGTQIRKAREQNRVQLPYAVPRKTSFFPSSCGRGLSTSASSPYRFSKETAALETGNGLLSPSENYFRFDPHPGAMRLGSGKSRLS